MSRERGDPISTRSLCNRHERHAKIHEFIVWQRVSYFFKRVKLNNRMKYSSKLFPLDCITQAWRNEEETKRNRAEEGGMHCVHPWKIRRKIIILHFYRDTIFSYFCVLFFSLYIYSWEILNQFLQNVKITYFFPSSMLICSNAM